MPRGRALRRMREAAGLRQADVARWIPAANGDGALDPSELSRIETERTRLPRGFSALYERALAQAAAHAEGTEADDD